jgi:membrane protein DedA with SNARE-associated domain
MSELIDALSTWISDTIESLGYVGIALIMLLENLIPPIPSELVMPFGGFLVAEGRMSFVGLVAAGTIGAVLGALALYGIGMWAGEPLLRQFLRRYGRWIGVSEAELDQALVAFGKRGDVIVFFGRLIPLIRSLISLPAGMNHMPLGRFLLYTTLGSTLWNTALAYAGLVLGRNWQSVLGFISQYQRLTLVVLAALVLLWIGGKIVRARRSQPPAVG